MKKINRPPVVRAKRLGTHLPVAGKIAEQHRIRETAPKSAVLTPLLSQLLASWNQSTDEFGQLADQVKVAEQVLRQLRGQFHTQLVRFGFDQRQFLSTVDQVCQGDVDQIHSLGCEAQVGRSAPLAVSPPEGLIAKPGTDPGAVHLQWTKAPGAKSYQLQMSTDVSSDTTWRALPGTTRTREAVGGLVSGRSYAFRVATLGAKGQSAYSQPVSAVAR